MKQFEAIVEAYSINMFSRGGGDVDVIALYQAIPDKNETDGSGKTLYHLAAKYADVEAINYLSKEGVKVRNDEYGNTPLHDLANSPLTNSITTIIQKEQAIFKTVQTLIDLKVNPKKKNDNGNIAFVEAGKKGMYPFIEAAAQAGIKMDTVVGEGKNLMHIICDQLAHRASITGVPEASYKIIKALLDSGVDPEDKDSYETTPLIYAQRSGAKEIAALLSGDESALKTGGMSMEQAVYKKDIEALETLLKNGADVNEVSENNRTPLMAACEYPSIEIVKLLIKNGADVNYKTGENGCTAVCYLLTDALNNLNRGVRGNQDPKIIHKILQALIEGDMDLNASVDNNGNTALNLLCTRDYMAGLNTRIAEELIEAGCDLNQANLEGKTPLMTFAAKGNEQEYGIAELLLENGANTKSVDKKSNSALMYAAGNSDKMSAKKIVELILDTDNKDLERVNNNGSTALDIAVAQNNEAVVKLLLGAM